MSFVHIVISIPVNDSFFAQISFVSIIQVLQFVDSVIYMYTYIERVPFLGFSQGAPYNLNPPLGIAQAKHCNLVCCSFVLRID